MSKRRIAVFLAGLGCLIVSRSLFAHHGNAAFDETKYLTITGTVTEWFWANPHCPQQMSTTPCGERRWPG